MPHLKVPEEHINGLSRIMRLSPAEVDLVVDALERMKSTNRQALTKQVREALPEMGKEDASEIVGTLLSLYSARTGMDLTLDSFVTEIIKASKHLDGQTQTHGGSEDTLKRLLGVRPLSMISKARGIHTDHENTFCTARIITDLRAVFDGDVKNEPVGFVMAHILHLGYHHDGKHSNLHLAMDKTDIDNLIVILERAKVKAATLSRAVTERAGFAILAE